MTDARRGEDRARTWRDSRGTFHLWSLQVYAGLLKVPAESARLLLSPFPLLRASGEDKGGSFTSESLNRKHNQISLRAAARCKVTNCLISLVLAHSALLSSFILLRRTATFPFFTPRLVLFCWAPSSSFFPSPRLSSYRLSPLFVPPFIGRELSGSVRSSFTATVTDSDFPSLEQHVPSLREIVYRLFFFFMHKSCKLCFFGHRLVSSTSSRWSSGLLSTQISTSPLVVRYYRGSFTPPRISFSSPIFRCFMCSLTQLFYYLTCRI